LHETSDIIDQVIDLPCIQVAETLLNADEKTLDD
jgi:hypothetical protein